MVILSAIIIVLILGVVIVSFWSPALIGVVGKEEKDPYNKQLEDVAPNEHHQDKVSTGEEDPAEH